jgi:hypothetical protein
VSQVSRWRFPTWLTWAQHVGQEAIRLVAHEEIGSFVTWGRWRFATWNRGPRGDLDRYTPLTWGPARGEPAGLAHYWPTSVAVGKSCAQCVLRFGQGRIAPQCARKLGGFGVARKCAHFLGCEAERKRSRALKNGRSIWMVNVAFLSKRKLTERPPAWSLPSPPPQLPVRGCSRW